MGHHRSLQSEHSQAQPTAKTMNFQSKSSSKLPWRKIAFVAIMLCIAGYKYYSSEIAGNADRPANQSTNDSDYTVNFPDQNSSSGGDRGDKFTPLKQSGSQSAGSFLVSAGGKKLESPAGLIYGPGSREGHRTKHVLHHAQDDRSRPVHGVFHAKGDEVFRLIDEAYELVKSNSHQVESEESGNRMAYVINMKREIGYKGGQRGSRNKTLSKIKLILQEGNKVITAFPY